MNNKRPLGLRLNYLIYYFLDKYYHQRKILKYLHNLQKKKLIESFDQIFRYASITTDQDLNEIRNVINEMAGNIETQLSYALQSIDERDSMLARKIIDRDELRKLQMMRNLEEI